MKKIPFSKRTIALFIAAGVLLVVGGGGSAAAALTAQSEVYEAQLLLSEIDVTLLENEVAVAEGEGFSSDLVTGNLLENLTTDADGNILDYVPGKSYREELAITNNGSIPTFYRVIITKRWEDENEMADTALNPEYIDLHFLTDNGWVIDPASVTPERTILYYTKALEPGETSPALSDTLTVSNEITKSVTRSEENGVVTLTYLYDGKSVCLAAEVDGVQAKHGQEAIMSAWGIEATVSDNTMQLQ